MFGEKGFHVKFPGAGLLARIVLALAAVAAVAIALTGCSSSSDSGASGKPKAGDCVAALEAGAADAKSIDCSSDKAIYRVAKAYDKKTDCSVGNIGQKSGDGYLCLAPNFKTGKCYLDSGATRWQQVDCASTEAAAVKVVERIDGKADELSCGAGAEKFLTLEEPKTTYCLARAKA